VRGFYDLLPIRFASISTNKLFQSFSAEHRIRAVGWPLMKRACYEFPLTSVHVGILRPIVGCILPIILISLTKSLSQETFSMDLPGREIGICIRCRMILYVVGGRITWRVTGHTLGTGRLIDSNVIKSHLGW